MQGYLNRAITLRADNENYLSMLHTEPSGFGILGATLNEITKEVMYVIKKMDDEHISIESAISSGHYLRRYCRQYTSHFI